MRAARDLLTPFFFKASYVLGFLTDGPGLLPGNTLSDLGLPYPPEKRAGRLPDLRGSHFWRLVKASGALGRGARVGAYLAVQ